MMVDNGDGTFIIKSSYSFEKQKPVAWMSPDGKFSTTEGKLFHIPLYTAPRELSDEEIMKEWEKAHKIGGTK
jgi:hypothetical protein